MTWATLKLLAGRVPSAVYVVALAVPLLAFSAHKYNDALRESGRKDEQIKQLNAALVVAEGVTRKADTIFVAKNATATAVHATIRTKLSVIHDTVSIPVTEVRTLVDSIIRTDSAALVAAEALLKAERAEKLIWRQKAETLAPTIVHVEHAWKHRRQGAEVGALVAGTIMFFVGRKV